MLIKEVERKANLVQVFMMKNSYPLNVKCLVLGSAVLTACFDDPVAYDLWQSGRDLMNSLVYMKLISLANICLGAPCVKLTCTVTVYLILFIEQIYSILE